MSEEQREILQMVSDGKISADDGAKLLEALKTGEQKRREMESPARRVREKKRIISEKKIMNHLAGMGNMREIGRMVRGMVRDSVSGISDDFAEIDEEMCEDAGLLEGPIELESGTELVLKRRRRVHMNTGGDLTLIGVVGFSLEAVGEDIPDIKVYRENGTVYLKWDTGDLTLNVPAAVDNVRASIMGGNIKLSGISASAQIKTKGGNINLSETSRAFSAKTMGGDIMIALTDNWSEDSEVATMGGNINLVLHSSNKAEISAKTMGGRIAVQEGIGELTESGHPGASRVNIDLSEGEECPDLSMKTMGGDISVTMSGAEPAEERDTEKKRSRKKKK
ncbi:MAG: DUF4097 family beta strand repeat protein [Candidatus Aegiribacteria sp.]|nr:DUF4097 family beta strand repeat protein [Candidatus Aegiribacteria sp.]